MGWQIIGGASLSCWFPKRNTEQVAQGCIYEKAGGFSCQKVSFV